MSESRAVLMRTAAQTAGRQLRELAVDLHRPVNVFGIIKDLGIELMFRPLEGKPDGFYLPSAGPNRRAGILLNSNRSSPRQRYTAAHELCHFIRGDPARIDVVREDCGYVSLGRSKEEVTADFFAAHFLMPPTLVTHLFRKMGLKKHDLTPGDVYRLALAMRTSYEATCNHLLNLQFISLNLHQTLRKIPPKRIKSEWASDVGHSDVWPLDQRMDGFYILPTTEDILRIDLAETPSTGFVWEIKDIDQKVLSVERSDLSFNSPEQRAGQTGARVFSLRVTGPGESQLKLILARPWNRNESVAEEFSLWISASEKGFVGHFAKDDFLMAA